MSEDVIVEAINKEQGGFIYNLIDPFDIGFEGFANAGIKRAKEMLNSNIEEIA